MSTKETGGPAFPCEGMDNGPGNFKGRPSDGMTLRQCAAIKLKVPDSGTDWLDEMITESLRDDFAEKALTGAFNSQGFTDDFTFEEKAKWVYAMADAMLEARKS